MGIPHGQLSASLETLPTPPRVHGSLGSASTAHQMANRQQNGSFIGDINLRTETVSEQLESLYRCRLLLAKTATLNVHDAFPRGRSQRDKLKMEAGFSKGKQNLTLLSSGGLEGWRRNSVWQLQLGIPRGGRMSAWRWRDW